MSKDVGFELRQLIANNTRELVTKRHVSQTTGTMAVLYSESTQCVFKMLRVDDDSELRAAEREYRMLLHASRAGCAASLFGVTLVDLHQLPIHSVARRCMAQTGSRRALVLRMERGTALSSRNCVITVTLAQQMIRAVKTLHDTGVVHLDLKPSSFVEMADGSVKLIDFGFARTLTIDGVCRTTPKGTEGYMSTNISNAMERRASSVTVSRKDDWASLIAMFERFRVRGDDSMSALIEECRQQLAHKPDGVLLPVRAPVVAKPHSAVVKDVTAAKPFNAVQNKTITRCDDVENRQVNMQM